MSDQISSAMHVDDEGNIRITDATLADQLLRDPRVVAARALEPQTPLVGEAAKAMAWFLSTEAGRQSQHSLLATDGEYHERLAGAVKTAFHELQKSDDFTTRIVTRAEAFADMLGAVYAVGTPRPIDVVPWVFLVPLAVIADAFGVDHDLDELHAWSRAQTDLIWRVDMNEARQMQGLFAAGNLKEVCVQTVQAHLDAGNDAPRNLTTSLLGAGLTTEEVIGLVYGLVIAGHEATGWSIANALHDLVGTDDWRTISVAEDWHDVVPLVRTQMRSNPGIHAIFRTASTDIDLDGYVVPKDARIVIDLLALNNGPGPDSTFGRAHNPHFCLGSHLGMLEVAITVWSIARRHPHASLVENQVTKAVDSRFFHGVQRLLMSLPD